MAKYDNIKALDINGDFAFYCSKKTSNWYIHKNLAKIIQQEPLIIQLIFRGKNFPQKPIIDPFFINLKINQCVVCGYEKELSTHHAIPLMYYKFLPGLQKIKNHHDLLFICYKCHNTYENKYAINLKKRIAYFIAKINRKEMHRYIQVIKKITVLLKYYKTVPEIHLNYLKNNINILIGHEVKENEYEEIINFARNKIITSSHGKMIVNKLQTNKRIIKFMKIWRKHFLITMKPKYLPIGWNINGKNVTRILENDTATYQQQLHADNVIA